MGGGAGSCSTRTAGRKTGISSPVTTLTSGRLGWRLYTPRVRTVLPCSYLIGGIKLSSPTSFGVITSHYLLLHMASGFPRTILLWVLLGARVGKWKIIQRRGKGSLYGGLDVYLFLSIMLRSWSAQYSRSAYGARFLVVFCWWARDYICTHSSCPSRHPVQSSSHFVSDIGLVLPFMESL